MSRNQSLGQVAFEEHYRLTLQHFNARWENELPIVQDAWERAALAVIAAYETERQKVCDE